MNNELLTTAVETGTVYKHEFSFTQEEVNRFAEVTGDTNPVHTDAAYAAATMFKRPIMHGFLGGSIFSKVFGTLFPGEGTIYLKQTMAFVKPMYVDTAYEAVFTVKEVQLEKHRATVETTIVEKETGDATIKGEAVVMNVTLIK
ncbi:MAG: MaoC family dehydratase [Hymenobacteraceae bacterium]|nr:MaoC family dehydratase [Hymenobacteraceae bacterium]MDX5396881.1 MaoC family dehydratase [Hymenobacteraceae bacterium]MDX5444327.1 MaoC family dehydratase [Hymenobacteraceae bacterium]MDX5512952.1 MaoC family dehydratase [Hymenobacteraceae bacterium]